MSIQLQQDNEADVEHVLADDLTGPRTPVMRAVAESARNVAAGLSDDEVQMSPAAARRLARRNLRSRPTPDLVSSLVRPPSPDSIYIPPEFHDRTQIGEIIGRGIFPRNSISNRLSGTDNGRRSGPLLPPHLSSLDIPKRYGSNAILDMYVLTYVTDTDPNLLCPICHDPLVDPVTTPCDHTFCYRCIRRSIASSPSGTACPIDREPLAWTDCFSAARLIRTQLNSLVVKCPHHGRGCIKEMRREIVERHATTECRFREFPCPSADCNKTVRYKPTDETCHHQEDTCTCCDSVIEDADRDIHLLSCTKSKTRCEACWQLVCRDEFDAHQEVECDGVEVHCPYKDVGCQVRVVRGNLELHSLACAFHPDTPSGAIIRTQRDLIQSYSDLESQLRDVHARQDEANRRLDEITTAIHRRESADSNFGDNRTIQDLDAGFEEVHQNLTHLEARQSMWTLNQVMPIREEVTELRNNINMIRMHVNWLLSRSRDEGRAVRSTTAAASSSSIHRDSSAERPPPPPLPHRRRSSNADIDIPRL